MRYVIHFIMYNGRYYIFCVLFVVYNDFDSSAIIVFRITKTDKRKPKMKIIYYNFKTIRSFLNEKVTVNVMNLCHFNDLQIGKGRSWFSKNPSRSSGRISIRSIKNPKMLRTIVTRNQVVNSSLKKAVRSSVTRCMSTELVRRKHSNK